MVGDRYLNFLIMRTLLIYLLLLPLAVTSQYGGFLKATRLKRNTGEYCGAWIQVPVDTTTDKTPCAVTFFYHGDGEKVRTALITDSTNSQGMRKLLVAGTGPTAVLATRMHPKYLNPGRTDYTRTIWIAPVLDSIKYANWQTWIDSAAWCYVRDSLGPIADTNRIACMGLSQGAFGTNIFISDSTLNKWRGHRLHSAAVSCSPGGWPNQITGTGYKWCARNWPPFFGFVAANDLTAGVSNSTGPYNSLNTTAATTGFKGPLNALNFIEFDGTEPATSGHVIWPVVFNFDPTAIDHPLINGYTYRFIMPMQQWVLQFTNPPGLPLGY